MDASLLTFCAIAHFAKLTRLARLYIRNVRMLSCSLDGSSITDPTRASTTPCGVPCPVLSISKMDIWYTLEEDESQPSLLDEVKQRTHRPPI